MNPRFPDDRTDWGNHVVDVYGEPLGLLPGRLSGISGHRDHERDKLPF